MKNIFLLLTVAVLFVFVSLVQAEEYGVYVKAVENVEGTLDAAVKNTEEALAKNSWQVLASYNATVPENCSFKAHTIVVHSQEYSRQILSHGPAASFAIPLRVELYGDETGLNIGFVNPSSINKTILGDDVEAKLSLATMKSLAEILASAVKGKVVNKQIGQLRDKGKVGGMGGGDFKDKIEVIYKKEDSAGVFEATAGKVKEGITANKLGWRLVYTLNPGNGDIVIYGVNKAETEARAYGIAGEKRASKDYRCPGIDHAAAFPIEVIVYKEKGMVKVVTLDEMYRMKLYFEDAGNWAFMKNMRMPGQIEEEIVEISSAKLKE